MCTWDAVSISELNAPGRPRLQMWGSPRKKATLSMLALQSRLWMVQIERRKIGGKRGL